MRLGRLALAALVLLDVRVASAQAKVTSGDPRDTTHAEHQAPFFTRKDALLGLGFGLGTVAMFPLDKHLAGRLQTNRERHGFLKNAARGDEVIASPGVNFMGGGRGLLGAGWGAIGGGAGAALTGGSTIGAAAGAAIPVVTAAGLKSAQNRMAMNQMAAIDELLRSRSPLYQQMLQNPALPGFDKQQLLLRALQATPQMWGALAPPPQSSR